jgi:hypothetical protein
MKRIRLINLLLGIVAVFLLAPLANADTLNVTLNDPNPTVVQSATQTVVQFFGTVSNPSLTDDIYVNADATSSATGTTVDDSLFQPFLIPANNMSGMFEIFDVDLVPGLGPGTYNGIFSFLGGADGGSFSAFDDLVDINFSVTVTAPTTTAPEPGSLLLLASGLASLVFLMRRSVTSNS